MQKNIPKVTSLLRRNILCMPEGIREASGIVINGRRIKSLVFTTDIAIVNVAGGKETTNIVRETLRNIKAHISLDKP